MTVIPHDLPPELTAEDIALPRDDPRVRAFELSPLSKAQETTLTDMVAMLGEWNAKLSETVCAQADVIMELSKKLTA